MLLADTAEAVRVYALQANDDELVNNAVEIKLHAKAKAKQMVDEGQKAGQLRKKEDGNRSLSHTAVTLKDVGLTKQEVNSWKPFAAVPERVLEKAIEVVKKRDPVLTYVIV